jgi:precorrin-6B methylase 2
MKKICLEIPKEIIKRGGDYTGHYPRTVTWKNKKVLDVGADVGSTAEWFLNHGARQVIAVEGNPKYYPFLEENAKRNPHLLKSLQLWVKTPETLENLFLAHRPDIVKIDCEGCELVLLMIYDEAFRIVPEHVIETHSLRAHKVILRRFRGVGYKILHGQHFRVKRTNPRNDFNVIHAKGLVSSSASRNLKRLLRTKDMLITL